VQAVQISVQATRAQLKAVENKLLAHPYLSAVEHGRITKEKLRLFAGEQYYIINSDQRSVALVNLPAWGSSCPRMSAALKDKYGLSSEAVTFFDLFAAPAPEFEADSLRVIQAGLDCDVDPSRRRPRRPSHPGLRVYVLGHPI